MTYHIEVTLTVAEDTDVWCADATACGVSDNSPRTYGECAGDLELLAELYPDREYRIAGSVAVQRRHA